MLTSSLALGAVVWLPAVFDGVWWPTAITLAAASACALGTIRLRSERHEPLGTRLTLVATLVALLALIAASRSGLLWPIALAAVPAFAFGLVALVRPALVFEKRHWSTYLAYASLAGALSILATGVDGFLSA